MNEKKEDSNTVKKISISLSPLIHGLLKEIMVKHGTKTDSLKMSHAISFCIASTHATQGIDMKKEFKWLRGAMNLQILENYRILEKMNRSAIIKIGRKQGVLLPDQNCMFEKVKSELVEFMETEIFGENGVLERLAGRDTE